MGCVKTAPVWLAAPVAWRATEGEGPEGGGIMGGWLYPVPTMMVPDAAF